MFQYADYNILCLTLLGIKQRFGLWRDVALLPNDKKIIEQGFGYPNITIEPGDRVFADFTYAHNDVRLSLSLLMALVTND